MNRILAKRYAFCDFSSIVGFPNQVPTRDEWENSLPRFHGEEWEVPAEHLLDFHEFINRLEIVHEDVQIKLFKFSLDGIALDWCRSLPNASVSSLADFHAAFHVFCKDHFPADLLYPQCCHEFHFLTKNSDVYEEYVVEVNAIHYDQEISNPHHDSHSDAFVIASNASPDLCCHEEEIVPIENLKSEEQILISASNSFRSAVDVEDSLPFPDLQKKTECSRHLQEGQQKDSDQQSVLYVLQADLEQPAFNSEISKDSFQHLFNLQLDQQSKEVLLCKFDDPFADYLEPISSMNVEIFMSEEDSLIHLLKPFFCMIWSLLLFGSRFNMMSVDQFLTWLHWKSSFT
jgi:hypothetical protein